MAEKLNSFSLDVSFVIYTLLLQNRDFFILKKKGKNRKKRKKGKQRKEN